MFIVGEMVRERHRVGSVRALRRIPMNRFGYIVERPTAMFTVVRLSDGTIYDGVSER